MSRLRLDPAEGSIRGTLGPETIAVQLEGGASRHRRTQLGAVALVDVEWVLESSAYDYFMAFYRARTAHGSLPFQLDLVLNKAAVAEYTAYFVPGSIELVGVKGSARIVSAQLEVVPLAENTIADLGLVYYRDAEAAAPGPLNMNLLHASLNFGGGVIQHNSFGWHSFYSDQWAADSIVASWRAGAGNLAIAGLMPSPPTDGNQAPGSFVIYAAESTGIAVLPPASGYAFLTSGWKQGDLFTVIIKGGYAHHFWTVGDSVRLLASYPVPAANWRFGGSIISGKITDIKLAVF